MHYIHYIYYMYYIHYICNIFNMLYIISWNNNTVMESDIDLTVKIVIEMRVNPYNVSTSILIT